MCAFYSFSSAIAKEAILEIAWSERGQLTEPDEQPKD